MKVCAQVLCGMCSEAHVGRQSVDTMFSSLQLAHLWTHYWSQCPVRFHCIKPLCLLICQLPLAVYLCSKIILVFIWLCSQSYAVYTRQVGFSPISPLVWLVVWVCTARWTPGSSVILFSGVSADPIVQVAIDDSRNTLYTRSEKGVLQVSSWFCSITCVTREQSVFSVVNTADISVYLPICLFCYRCMILELMDREWVVWQPCPRTLLWQPLETSLGLFARSTCNNI